MKGRDRAWRVVVVVGFLGDEDRGSLPPLCIFTLTLLMIV